MAPVVCGLGVRFLPERLSVLLAAGAVSPAAGRRGGGDCRRGNSQAGAGKKPWVCAPLRPPLAGTGAAAPMPDPASAFPNASRTTAASSPQDFFDPEAE